MREEETDQVEEDDRRGRGRVRKKRGRRRKRKNRAVNDLKHKAKVTLGIALWLSSEQYSQEEGKGGREGVTLTSLGQCYINKIPNSQFLSTPLRAHVLESGKTSLKCHTLKS